MCTCICDGGPTARLSDLMRTVKSRSSKWMHDDVPGACRVRLARRLQRVLGQQVSGGRREGDTSARQAEHHKAEDFKSELLRMLRAHGVEFDERYVFD